MKLLPVLDIGIIVPILGLIGTSLAIIGSTTPTLFYQQLVFFIFGLICCYVFASIDYRIWRNFIWIFYGLSIFLLLLTFFVPQVRGSSRWIDIGWVSIQSSEIVKPLVLIIIAEVLSRRRKNSFIHYLFPFLLLLPVVAIIFRQPDLGNVLVYFFIYIMMIIANGFPLFVLSSIFLLFGLGFPFLWHILKDYQKNRILSFLNPHADPIGAGYNALQAVIAIGSGQLTGLGLGKGTQSHLLFLPEYHTDFVFASLGEELGLVGASLVLIFYAFLLTRIVRISFDTEDTFTYLLSLGIFSQLFIQIFINIGMNLGILPITGITLPLISYGGSSIVSTMISLGLCISILRVKQTEQPVVIR